MSCSELMKHGKTEESHCPIACAERKRISVQRRPSVRQLWARDLTRFTTPCTYSTSIPASKHRTTPKESIQPQLMCRLKHPDKVHEAFSLLGRSNYAVHEAPEQPRRRRSPADVMNLCSWQRWARPRVSSHPTFMDPLAA